MLAAALHTSSLPCHGCASAVCAAHFDAALATAAMATNDTWHDLRWCRANTDYTAPLHLACADPECAALVNAGARWTGARVSLGVIVVDTRDTHPGLRLWHAYCFFHNYTLIRRRPRLPPRALLTMAHDWDSTRIVLEVLRSPAYAALDYFLYTELDQWVVRPMARLEPTILHALAPPHLMAVGGEFPCRDVRRGGLFNMGTYFLRRGARVEQLLGAWFNSSAHGGPEKPSWPARQGAFSHDGSVYWAHRDIIYAFRSGCMSGSPFAPAIAHVLGGQVAGAFDTTRARLQFELSIVPCALEAIRRRSDVACALPPEEAGGVPLPRGMAVQVGGAQEAAGRLDGAAANHAAGESSTASGRDLARIAVNGTVVVSVATLPEYCKGVHALAESARSAGLGPVFAAVSQQAGCEGSTRVVIRRYEPWASVLQAACAGEECVWPCAYRATWSLKFRAVAEVLEHGWNALVLDSDWVVRDGGLLPLLSQLEVGAPAVQATRSPESAPRASPLGVHHPDVVALIDPLVSHHARMVNVGLLWIVSTPTTRALAQRVANRSLHGWDQATFNEELRHSTGVLCCGANGIETGLERAVGMRSAAGGPDGNDRLRMAHAMPLDVSARWLRIAKCAALADDAGVAALHAPVLPRPSEHDSPFASWQPERYNAWSRRVGAPQCTPCITRERRKRPNCIGHPNSCPYERFGLAPTPRAAGAEKPPAATPANTVLPPAEEGASARSPPPRLALSELFVTQEALANASHPVWRQVDFANAEYLRFVRPPSTAELHKALPSVHHASCAVVGASNYLRECAAAAAICEHDVVIRVNDHGSVTEQCTRTDVQVLNQYACVSVPAPRAKQGQPPWERPSTHPRFAANWWRDQPLHTLGREQMLPCGGMRQECSDATGEQPCTSNSRRPELPKPRVRLRVEWFADGRVGSAIQSWLSSGADAAYAHRNVWEAHRRQCPTAGSCKRTTIAGGEGAASTGGVAVAFALLACRTVTLYGFGGRSYRDSDAEWRGEWHDIVAEHAWMRGLVRDGHVRTMCSNLTDDPPSRYELGATAGGPRAKLRNEKQAAAEARAAAGRVAAAKEIVSSHESGSALIGGDGKLAFALHNTG